MPETVAVIDFETTGLSPSTGGRATEIAAVRVRDGRVVDHYASLMRSDAWVSPFIERLTGISNEMLADAPPAAQVMREVAAFVGDSPLVAHNAAFDRAFWRAELRRAGEDADQPFACTLLLGRRLYPSSPDHRLGTLAAWHGLAAAGPAHRALADAQTAAMLWLQIQRDVRQRFGLASASHELLSSMQRSSRDTLARCVALHHYAAGAEGAAKPAGPRQRTATSLP